MPKHGKTKLTTATCAHVLAPPLRKNCLIPLRLLTPFTSFAKRLSCHERRCRPHHLRFLSNSQSRPVAATIKTTMMLHRVDDGGSSIEVGTVGAVSGGLFPGSDWMNSGAGDLMADAFLSDGVGINPWCLPTEDESPSMIPHFFLTATSSVSANAFRRPGLEMTS